MNQYTLDVTEAYNTITNHLQRRGWSPDSVSRSDWTLNGKTPTDDQPQFKIGTSFGTITILIRYGRKQNQTLRATNPKQINDMLIAIDRHILHKTNTTGELN